MNVSFGPDTGLAAPSEAKPVIDVPAQTAPAEATAPVTPATPETPAAAPVATPATPAATPTPPADGRPFPEGSLTPVQHAAKTGGLMLGDSIPEFKDIILPRINIVQGVGDLKESFTQGGIVFNQSTLLFEPADIDKASGNVKRKASPPVTIAVLGFRPSRFVEKIEGGGKGLIVNTEAEVRNNGGTLDYKEWNLKKASGMKLFQVLADALVAIERPESCADDDTVFVYEVEGKKFALAIWSLKGSAYTAAAKRVFFTARTCGCLRQGYPTHQYSLSTRLESFNNGANKAWVPVCVPKAKSSPAFLAWVASVLTAPEAPAEGTDNA